jgi:hypothetical protein
MGGYVGSWVATSTVCTRREMGGYVPSIWGNGWLFKERLGKKGVGWLRGRWVAKLVVRLLSTAAPWVRNFESRHLPKMEEKYVTLQKSGPNTLLPVKKVEILYNANEESPREISLVRIEF